MAKSTGFSVEELEQKLLDAYFAERSPQPVDGYVSDPKSSADVREDLYDMVTLTNDAIVEYMASNLYNPMTLPDGTIKWAIWRKLRVPE